MIILQHHARALQIEYGSRHHETSGQSYKHFTIVINDPRVVTWAIS